MEEIEYKLRFLLNSTTLTVTDAKIKDTSEIDQLQFLKKYKNQKIIYAFIKEPVKDAPISTPLVGVPINKTETSHNLLYCKIAVGLSLYTSEEYAMNCKTPSGYDSFIISSNSEPIESVISAHRKSNSLSSYSYVIPDRSRVLVLADVSFNYDMKLEEKSKNNDVCEYCSTYTATSFCLAERAAFCGKCDEFFHSNGFTQRHSRYYFDKVGKKRFIHCKAHKSVVVDYFCVDCSVPVCTQCRIGGAGLSVHTSHKMISYIEACDSLREQVKANKEMDLVIRRASKSVSDVEREIEKFEGEIESIRSKIQYEYDTAISVLNDLVKRRYQKINGRYFSSKYLMEIGKRASVYPTEIDPSVLVEKWRAVKETNRSISEIGVEEETKSPQIVVRGSITVETASGQESSPVGGGAEYEDEFIRRRTEMLLRVSQFKTGE